MFSGIITSCYGSNLLRTIVDHPFNVELMNNTLNIESFKFYVQQGVLLLDSYIRTVLVVAFKVEDHNSIIPLTQVAQGIMTIQRVVHGHYFAIYGISRGKKSPECFNFANFLSSISYRDTYEAVTVLYSCMLIWKSIIDSMKNGFSKNNRYKDWFSLCSSSLVDPGFIILEDIVDGYCSKVRESRRSRMLELFRITAQFLLDFWNGAYHFSEFDQFPKRH